MLPLRMLGFLMLMLSLCDADNLCPTDLNPLTLDPPEVLYGYEESVVVNCTSTDDYHEGMYWTVGNTDHPMTIDSHYIQVSLSNWNVKAECKIKLNDTHECSKDLKITVYKNPEMVRVFPARHVPIVEETPFKLQCDIDNVAPVQNLTVRWYKNNHAIREDRFPNPTKTPINESSTLIVNISREENGAKFRCEAQLDFPHGSQPVTSDTYTVAMHYAPALKNKMEDVYVNKENSVTLNCDAEGHPPPHFNWTCDGLNILENTNNLSITQVITSTTCDCTATNYLGRINKQIHVHVIPRGCPLVVTPAEMVVRFGDPASVNCSTDADVQQMGWEAPDGATSGPGPAVIWKVEKLEDWQITPLCFINLKENYQCSKKLTITLYKTPDIVSVSALDDGPMVEGTGYHLNCDIINVAPVQKLKVTWYRGNETVHTDVFKETSNVPVNVSSTLRVNPVGDYNRAHFICKAELQLGQNGPETDITVTSSPYIAVVHYKPVLKACPARYSGVEHEFSMDKLPCLADGNPPPIVKWYLDGDLINASEPLTRTQSGNYTAEIYNNLGRSTTSIVITIEYAPELKNKTEDVYVNKENSVTLNCDAEGHPPPHFNWTCDGLNILENTNNLSITQVITSTTCDCTATNYLGRINKQIHVHVIPRGCPLVVTPAEMVVRFGDPASVNCSTDADVQQMGWEAPDGATSGPGPAVIWKVEKLEDWKITPLCFINLKDNYQCSKKLTITLYKTPDIVSVSALDDGPMVEGTGYHLNCDIINVAPVQKLKVTWYRGNETVHTDVFKETSNVPVNVSSTLRVNPVGDYNRAHFICKAELQLGQNGPETDITVTSSPYIAVVHYKPVLKACPARYSGVEHEFSMDKLPCLADGNPPPIVKWYLDGDLINASEPLTRTQSGNYTAEIYNNLGRSTTSIVITIEYAPELKNKTEDVYVNKENSVTLNCDAEGHPPPHFNWTCDGLNILENTNNLSITQVITSTTCDCTATNYLGRINKQIHVHVIPRGCPLVVTPAEMVVRFGDPASVNCSTDADVQQMGWEAPDGATSGPGPAVIWKVEKLEDWQITPLCFINLKDNYQCSKKLTITLYKTPDIVSVSALDDGPMVEGTEYHLNCDIINVAPVQKLKVTWYRGNETVHTDVFKETSNVPVNVSSTLRVTPVGDYNRAHFICKAELQLGQNGPETDITVTSSPYIAVVHYKPVLKACPARYSGVEHEFSMDKLPCLADGNPPPIVKWYLDGDLINASEPLTRTQSGNYTADISNKLGRSTTSIVITIEYGPLFLCKHRYKVKENENGKLPCEPKGIPKPTITWNKDGNEIESPQRWTKHDGGNYSLFATNKHGTANHVLHLEVLYAPVFKEGTSKKEVNLGENVTIDCSAEGNPVPEIRWTFSPAVNVKNITRGSQKNIHITGATSTHAGVYSCDAINEVGTETKSVTLTMKDKTSKVFSTATWWIIIFIAILILIILIFILTWVYNRCKKLGQYSFVPDIPMTQSNGVYA